MIELNCWFEIPKDKITSEKAQKSAFVTHCALNEMPATGNYLLQCGLKHFDNLSTKEVMQHAHYMYEQQK